MSCFFSIYIHIHSVSVHIEGEITRIITILSILPVISKAFIVRRYPYLDERWVRDLFPNEPLTIHVFDRQKGGSMYQLRVIAIPANHCPGSVMCVMDFYHEIPVGHYVIYTVMSFSGFASRH